MAESSVVTVNGHELPIDEEARGSWEMFDLMCEVGTDFDQTKMPYAFQLIELCCGVTKDEFIELCGGKRTPYTEVLGHVAAALTAIVPKN